MLDMAEPDLRPYLDRLARLPFVRAVHLHSKDAVGLTTPEGQTDLPVLYRGSVLNAALVEHMKVTATHRPGLLVLAPVIGSTPGEALAAAGVNFVDLAGNCHVRLGDRYFAWVQGRRAEQRAPGEKALRGPAYRVFAALLAKPELVSATARSLAEAAGGVSPQTANDVRHRLEARGLLLRTRGGATWANGGYRAMLELFVAGFPTLLPGLGLGRYRARGRNPEEVEAALAPALSRVGDWRWGGAAAAWRLTGYYRGDATLVYLRDPDATALSALPLIPDASGNVIVRRAPATAALEGHTPDTVHPTLVYADLLLEGNTRAREAAGEIHRRFVAVDAQAAP